jgi:D-3-phosphoglycerate dehydrogenase
MSYRIVVSDHLPQLGWELLQQAEDVQTVGPYIDRDELLAALPGAQALIVRGGSQVDRALIDQAPNLKVIARAGARHDNIDLDYATRKGILVVNVPAANRYAAVEHTFGLLLTLARDLTRGVNELRAGRWPRYQIVGFQLHGKTLGLIGLGGLGQAMAERAHAFGMHVLVYDPYIDLSFAREHAVEVVGFHELLSRSDIIIPQTPYSETTHRMFDTEAFSKMRPEAYFINVVDPRLIDETALLTALDEGRLAGAALDTFQEEPPSADHPLVAHPLVLPTPHLNQNTHESQAQTGQIVVSSVLAALRKTDYDNVLNLPFREAGAYKRAEPYIRLAEKLGRLQGQLAEGWINGLDVEILGEGLQDLVRPAAAMLLSGLIRPKNGQAINWVSAPVIASEQGLQTAQVKNLLDRADYPNLLICKVRWEGGSRTVAGVLFANGDSRLVHYDGFEVDAAPEGYVLVLENDDVPGVIGKVGSMLGQAGVNIANWRYGREVHGGRAVSFINLDHRVSRSQCQTLEDEPEIQRARLIKL